MRDVGSGRAVRAPAHTRAPAPRCALTVDLEEWFHGLDLPAAGWAGLESRVEAAATHLLDLLALHDARATFFVLGRVADAYPELVGRILSAGHEVGSHGYDHQFVYRQSPEEFARDLDRSLRALERAGAPPVRAYRAPYFSITRRSLWALDTLVAAGIDLDSSIMPAPNPRYGIPDAPLGPHLVETPSGRSILEVPVSCLGLGPVRVPFAGGFYLRFFPRAAVRFLIRRTLAGGRPVVLYLHPWELDPGQPRLTLPGRVAATRYHRLRSTAGKLASLLGTFRWTTLSEAVGDQPTLRNPDIDTIWLDSPSLIPVR